MPAQNRYHRSVIRTLERDGWTITHDPLRLHWGSRDLLDDLGTGGLLGASKGQRKIATEIGSLCEEFDEERLKVAVGRFILYGAILARVDPDRHLYLAASDQVYLEMVQEPLGQLILEEERLRPLVFDPPTQTIREWGR